MCLATEYSVCVFRGYVDCIRSAIPLQALTVMLSSLKGHEHEKQEAVLLTVFQAYKQFVRRLGDESWPSSLRMWKRRAGRFKSHTARWDLSDPLARV